MKFKLLTFILCCLWCFSLLAEESFAFQMQRNIGLTGLSKDENSSDLQVDSLSENAFEFQYDFSQSDSFFISGGYSVQERKFVLYPDGNDNSSEKYSLDLNYYFLKAGYDVNFSNIKVKPSLKLGFGSYEFTGENSVSKSGDTTSIGFECNMTGTISSSGLNYLIGFGYSNLGETEIDDFGGSSIAKEMGAINFGLGYSF